jgi:crotonobetainyl-CoA:carnitine CoA-transferase CaiB-like acyl-CoA transferase
VSLLSYPVLVVKVDIKFVHGLTPSIQGASLVSICDFTQGVVSILGIVHHLVYGERGGHDSTQRVDQALGDITYSRSAMCIRGSFAVVWRNQARGATWRVDRALGRHCCHVAGGSGTPVGVVQCGVG